MATAPLTQTTGRRKEAVARARLRPGTGVLTVNVPDIGVSAVPAGTPVFDAFGQPDCGDAGDEDVWLGVGAGVDRVWLGDGAGADRVWLGDGAGTDRDWLGDGAGADVVGSGCTGVVDDPTVATVASGRLAVRRVGEKAMST